MEKGALLVRSFVENHPRDAAQALEQLDISEAVGIVKEVLAGLFNGIAVAVGTAGAVWVWSRNYGLALVIFYP
jgi:hypothetical protein